MFVERYLSKTVDEDNYLEFINRELYRLLPSMVDEINRKGGDIEVIDDDYQVLLEDGIILCEDGVALTISLYPVSSNPGKIIVFKKMGDSAHNVVIDGYGAETIDGATTRTLAQNYGTMTILAAEDEWLIIAGAGT